MAKAGMNPAALGALARGDLANALVASTPGGIERQEKEGQTSFVATEALPRQMRDAKPILESWGVVFGDDIDDCFVQAKLPEGWKKQATDHPMWSNLVDDKGRVRAAIFYKAAFYDRSAHLTLQRRYRVDGYVPCNADGTLVPEGQVRSTHFKTVVRDAGASIHELGIRKADDYDLGDVLHEQAKAWLTTTYPDWEKPTTYWD